MKSGEHVREAKLAASDELRREVARILEKLKAETGLAPTSIDIEMWPVQRTVSDSSAHELGRVRINISI